MMHAYAVLIDPEGQAHELVGGDLIGRLDTAALHIDDGRVSEAHAMLSLRDGSLRLLSLRGAFAVDGRPTDDLELRAGQEVQLAPGVALRVAEVVLPEAVLGIEGPSLVRRVLPPVCSVLANGRLVAGWQTDAAAQIWSTGGGWRVRESGETRMLQAGDQLGELRLVAVPLNHASQTRTQQGGVDTPLHLIAHYDTVHIHREGRLVLTLSGVCARIVSELVSFAGPVAWATLAAEVWPDAEEPLVARARFDANLARIRRKLRASSVRTDLLHTDGAGQLQLLLYPYDRVEDQT